MKNNNAMRTFKIITTILLVTLFLFGCKQQPKEEEKTKKTTDKEEFELVSQWSTDTVLKIPESVYYDKVKDVLYVSNIDGKPTQKDGKGFISKVSTDGEILNLKWVTGIDAPKGMGVYEGKLYVTNIDEIVKIDIDEGKIEKRYPCKGAKFANDIAIGEDGTVFASDMSTGLIYRLKEDQAEQWIKSDKLKSPNGLYTTPDHLLIGMKGAVMKADYNKGKLKKFISNTGGIDGLKEVGDGYFIKSDWTGHVHILHPEKSKKMILNTAKNNINAADIEFDKAKNMLYVPTFNDNRVMAYKLKR
jgi:outer membrane protein assembly factor BamB